MLCISVSGAWWRRALFVAVMSLFAAPLAASAAAPGVTMTEYTVPSDEPGVALYVREKRPSALTTFAGDRVIIMVHGVTYPIEAAFDTPIAGVSFMDRLAGAGYDVFAVDMPGYGGSTRPPAMAEPATANPPLTRTPVAARALGAAARYVRRLRGVDAINVLGWSWGTSIAGMYVLGDQQHVRALVQYAPQWLKEPTVPAPSTTIAAYRTVTREQIYERWYKDVPESGRADLIPPEGFEAFWQAAIATDPVGAAMTPPQLRAPNGTSIDSAQFWNAGKPLYDPAGIMTPTMVIHAEWDADLPTYLARGYFAKLGTHRKRFVEIAEGTHSIIMERNRAVFAYEIIGFLNNP